MADTLRGDFSELVCSDCGKKGCEFRHWGPLVPSGQSGNFCVNCMAVRSQEFMKGNNPRPLGQPPIASVDSVKSGVYRHFKGNIYHVIGVSENTETKELTVICIPQYGEHKDKICNRKLEMFLEEVDRPELNYKGPRFVLIEERQFLC